MKVTSVSLDKPTEKKLRVLSKRYHISKASIIRMAISLFSELDIPSYIRNSKGKNV